MTTSSVSDEDYSTKALN